MELEKASQPSSLSRHCCNQGHREGDRHYDRSKREVYLKYLSWRLPIGSLTTEITRSPHSHGKYGELDLDQCDHETSTYEFTFIAPAWLSTSIIQLSFKARSQHGLTNWNRNLSFGMHNYNTNPQLKKYLDAGDQAGLNRLFLEGKAKPTDYLPGGFTLLMVCYLPSEILSQAKAHGITWVIYRSHFGLIGGYKTAFNLRWFNFCSNKAQRCMVRTYFLLHSVLIWPSKEEPRRDGTLWLCFLGMERVYLQGALPLLQ